MTVRQMILSLALAAIVSGVAGVLFERFFGVGNLLAVLGIRKAPPVDTRFAARLEAIAAEPGRHYAVEMWGDSLVAYQSGWGELLGGCSVANRGIAGIRMDELGDVARFGTADAYVVMAGINDLQAGAEPELLGERLTKLLRLCPDARRVRVVGIPPAPGGNRRLLSPQRIERGNAALRAACIASGARFVDASGLDDPSGTRAFAVDGVHLSASGYRKLAERIVSALQTASAPQDARP